MKIPITSTTRLILDSNEYIFGTTSTKDSCVALLNYLPHLTIFVPAMVIHEVQQNLKYHFGLPNVLFRLIGNEENINLVWQSPDEAMVKTYRQRGLPLEDATIATIAEMFNVDYVISENRHFLLQADSLPFRVVNAEAALNLLEI